MARQKEKYGKKLRFSIIHDDSHKELFSFRTSKINIILITILVLLAIMAGTYLLTSRTFIRQTIPGYPSSETRRMAVENAIKLDSLERTVEMWAFQVANIQRIVTGKKPLTPDSLGLIKEVPLIDESLSDLYFRSDSLLRDEVLRREQYNVSGRRQEIEQIEGLHFFTPVSGIITEGYNKATGHPYIDIAAQTGTIVHSILDGTVISAGWSDDTGYTLQIQHSHDIISVYKHNEQLLKSTGDKVKAGTPIAMVGNTGKLSTGSHLHFELWHKGEAVDPTLYIKF
jgi:murein DD-endopeptidase MepM/ murein hydrolase activator NlpD